MPEKTDAKVVTTRNVLNQILLKETTLAKAIVDGTVRVTGSGQSLQQFFGYLDPPHDVTKIKISLR
jgi:alkyl sulfatase BDS1-like metallo-beta-lactamase superfamily hydrolase